MRIFRFRLFKWFRGYLASLSLTALAVFGGVIFVFTAGGGAAAYRLYDYVQHDNDFCVSCHLMEDPFERFETSAHRGLGCKACHQPNPIERAKMGLTQIVKNPEVIGVHAEVPNERCRECHVEGDPESWLIISNSRGHRLHLESADARLEDLECVTCHSESVHVFGASNGACIQSGCHDELEVALGEMSEMELACVTCHDFVDPASGPPEGWHVADSISMRPNAGDCLSCHEMRGRAAIDVDTEPHGANCSTCHNAHAQRRAADAEMRCSDGLCHGVPRDVEDSHHQWRGVDLLACTQCHKPHDFRVDGSRCGDCHDDVVGDASSVGSQADESAGRSPAVLATTAWLGARAVPPSGPAPPRSSVRTVSLDDLLAATQQVPPQSRDSVFAHSRHRSVACASCHDRANSANVNNQAWCVGCHHGPRSGRQCVACHESEALEGVTETLVMTLPGGPEERVLTFGHARHTESRECAECHGQPPTRAEAHGACLECHEQHHTAQVVDCVQCHEQPPTWAHEARVVHRGCTGGVCHTRFPVDDPTEMARPVCEACHTEFQDGRALPELPLWEPPDRDSSAVDTLAWDTLSTRDRLFP